MGVASGEGALLPSGRGFLVAVAKLRFRFLGAARLRRVTFFFDGKKKVTKKKSRPAGLLAQE